MLIPHGEFMSHLNTRSHKPTLLSPLISERHIKKAVAFYIPLQEQPGKQSVDFSKTNQDTSPLSPDQASTSENTPESVSNNTDSVVVSNNDNNDNDQGMSQPDGQAAPAQAAAQIPSTILDSLLLPKIFSGKRGEDGKEWWAEFKTFTEFRGLSEPQSLKLFQLLQNAYSKAWFNNLSAEEKDTFEHLQEAFKNEFEVASVDDWKARAETLKRTQHPGESPLEFAKELIKNAAKHKIDNDTTMAILIQGLQKEVKTFVAQRNPKNLDEALEAIKIADSVLEVSTPEEQAIAEKLDKITQQLKALTHSQQGAVAAVQAPKSYTRRTDNYNNTRPPFQTFRSQQQDRARSPFRGTGNNRVGLRTPQSPGRRCGRCGKSHTTSSFSSDSPNAVSSQCRAMNSNCLRCQKPGHFRVMCRSRVMPRSRSPNMSH